jgi:FkbM family methyltransferase
MIDPKATAKASGKSGLPAARLLPLLRMGRITRYSPSWRGFSQLLWFYRKILPDGLLLRIDNVDGDLLFDVDLRGDMGIALWHFPDLVEKEQRQVFCSSITPGCTVLDVGANIGFYTLLAAKRGARVFAIEADPLNAAMLRHHVEINGFTDRVTIYEMAATERDQAVPLYRHPFNLGESNIIEFGKPSGVVKGRPLDSLDLPPIEVCKMDIEGAEPMALRGMQQTLARSPNLKLLVEYNERFGHAEDLISYLQNNFSSWRVLERVKSPGKLPLFCNLFAVR